MLLRISQGVFFVAVGSLMTYMGYRNEISPNYVPDLAIGLALGPFIVAFGIMVFGQIFLMREKQVK